MKRAPQPLTLLSLILLGLLLAGCHTDMWIQPKVKAQTESDFWPDEKANRHPPANTVQYGQPKIDEAVYTGYVDGELVREFPVEVDREFVELGREKFLIYCQHCHGALGDGQGMIAERGLAIDREPANYHTTRLRRLPIGHFFDVITNGVGVMYPFSDRITPEERWAVAAYIRVLQQSQYTYVDELSQEQLEELYEDMEQAQAEAAETEDTYGNE